MSLSPKKRREDISPIKIEIKTKPVTPILRNTTKQSTKREVTPKNRATKVRPFTVKSKKPEITPFDELNNTEHTHRDYKLYKGPVDINCTSLKAPRKIKEDIARLLVSAKVSYKISSVILTNIVVSI
jgi:hypothetical protein